MPNKLLGVDPRSFLVAAVFWCLCIGFTLLGPGHVLETNNTFEIMYSLPVPHWFWGWAMMADAGLIIVSIFELTERISEAVIIIVTAAFWGMIGGIMLLGGALAGHFSGGGAFSMAIGGMSILAVGQRGAQPYDRR